MPDGVLWASKFSEMFIIKMTLMRDELVKLRASQLRQAGLLEGFSPSSREALFGSTGTTRTSVCRAYKQPDELRTLDSIA